EGGNGPNLTNLTQVRNFIEGRTADATFMGKTLNYSTTAANGLGMGNTLQNFLGADAVTLSTDPGNTSDAIIKLSGYVSLAAGTHKFRVTADDGYSVRINGELVASFNGNQSATAREGITFNVTNPGPQQIEIIYWDQGGGAQLKVELSQNGAPFEVVGGNALHHFPANADLVGTSGQALTIDPATLLGNDTDPDAGDALSIHSVQGAVNGSVALVNGQIVFTPKAGFYGDASFTYTVTDGKQGFDTATVTVKVMQGGGNSLM